MSLLIFQINKVTSNRTYESFPTSISTIGTNVKVSKVLCSVFYRMVEFGVFIIWGVRDTLPITKLLTQINLGIKPRGITVGSQSKESKGIEVSNS